MAKNKSNDELYLKNVASKGGRPKRVLTDEGQKLVKSLARVMCTDEEIASIIGCSVDTLLNANNKEAFTECKRKGQEEGKASLRRTQFELAGKNATMAIWLGKQYLQQKDEVSAEISSMPVIVVDV